VGLEMTWDELEVRLKGLEIDMKISYGKDCERY